jgi:hypothetical protein
MEAGDDYHGLVFENEEKRIGDAVQPGTARVPEHNRKLPGALAQAPDHNVNFLSSALAARVKITVSTMDNAAQVRPSGLPRPHRFSDRYQVRKAGG